ncbi:MAG: hypothetical protein KDA71_14735, partial [Planctomycetales bacterium]|nr:hypothetical protein [Planctomycetales bacterium]
MTSARACSRAAMPGELVGDGLRKCALVKSPARLGRPPESQASPTCLPHFLWDATEDRGYGDFV